MIIPIVILLMNIILHVGEEFIVIVFIHKQLFIYENYLDYISLQTDKLIKDMVLLL